MELGDGDAPPATGFSLEPLVLEPSAAVLDRLGTRRIDSGARGDAREPGYLDFADSSSRYDVREAFLRWELSAPATTYRVVIHYALSSGSRPGRLLFNGEPVADLAFGGTGSWSSWSQEVLELESDRPLESVTIQPTTTRGGPNVDYVELFALEEPVRVDDLTPGELSTPSAATYTRLDSRPRAFASRVRTPFNGNGHAENWDGRIFVARRAPGGAGGWYAQTFRPERVTLGADGAPNFSEAFGERIPLETDAENPNLDHNWLALAPDPSVTTENPYPSDARGRYALAGTHRTYKALVYSTNERGRGGVDREVRTLGQRRATFVVQNAHTRDAELVSAEFDGAWVPFEVNGTRNGLDCIEPTITNDGRLVVCQGHQDNGGRIDRLVYSWNAVPGRAAGWSFPMPLAQMHQVRDVDVAGVPFGVRFPLAQRPLRDQRGVEYAPTDEIRGAYPWISRDGSELFYQASRQGVSARRSATTVVGRWTGWNMRHIDGPINFMIGSSRLFLSSPGSFTTMWSPYKDVPNLPLPYSVRGPSYPLFHSNGSDYSEVSFEDYLDGNYVLFYGMNHQVDRDGNYLTDRTNDTSGHFHNGTLRDARFPIEQNGADESVGRHGQAIYFRDGGYVEVQRSEAFDRLRTAASVEMFVRRLVVRSREVPLFALEGGLSMSLDDRGRLVARVQDGAATDTLVAPASSAITGDVWVHVAMTYDGRTKALRLYVGGEQVASSMARIGELRTSGAVTVGPRGVPAGFLLLDEVKVSDVARAPHEIRHSANVLTNRGTQRELADATPSHLRSLTRFAPRVDGFSAAAAALGEDLFAAPILSATRSTTCTSCHVAELAFTDALPIAESAEPGAPAGTRNTPTILNRLFSGFQLWDGRAGSLVEQATIPIAAAHEMNLPLDQAVERLRTEGDWAARFRAAFGEEPSVRTLATALASFEVLLFSPPTRVDRYLDGDLGALDASERRGLLLFEGKARCSGCHAGRNFTDESFRSTGLVADDDPGRAGVTGRGRDLRAFRVPTLRGLVQTAPYMHDGSFATLRQVVEAYDRGVAVDGAPVDTDIRLGKVRLRFELAEERRQLPLMDAERFGGMVGGSVPMRRVFHALARCAKSDITVLVEGETGTGKEGAAAAIHSESDRSEGPFVIVDCSALPTNLFESELFGHEKGSFTGAVSRRIGAFERAHGGTIFLDEIGELPRDLQPKLLRVLEQKTVRRVGSNEHLPVDVRVVAATSLVMDEEMPIAPGAESTESAERTSTSEPDAPVSVGAPLSDVRLDMPLFEAKNQLVSAFERAYLVASLKAHEGNKAAVARAAGVDRGHLYRLLKKYGIDDDERG